MHFTHSPPANGKNMNQRDTKHGSVGSRPGCSFWGRRIAGTGKVGWRVVVLVFRIAVVGARMERVLVLRLGVVRLRYEREVRFDRGRRERRYFRGGIVGLGVGGAGCGGIE